MSARLRERCIVGTFADSSSRGEVSGLAGGERWHSRPVRVSMLFHWGEGRYTSKMACKVVIIAKGCSDLTFRARGILKLDHHREPPICVRANQGQPPVLPSGPLGITEVP